MSERAPLRVVATHDFCCAYPPSPTSCWLPRTPDVPARACFQASPETLESRLQRMSNPA
jgi:hypothetical protein